MEDLAIDQESVVLDQGVLEQTGFLLVQVSATTAGISGNVVVDIRRGDGTGGSLRAARVTVDFSSGINFAHIMMPVAADEAFIIFGEPKQGAASPVISMRKFFI
ncbi:MAG: hypothetical protein NTX57_12975 [Armatimonadetes bacterium]|nr:hypothetical protein [Armatimonadota bacterium]